jgi:hypothetical protein
MLSELCLSIQRFTRAEGAAGREAISEHQKRGVHWIHDTRGGQWDPFGLVEFDVQAPKQCALFFLLKNRKYQNCNFENYYGHGIVA